MNHANELRLAARATELGNGADAAAFDELAALTRSASARVRRLAASALGKLAGIVPAESAVAALLPLLGDAHPQVRQYSAKALGAFGAEARKALPDLRNLYRNPAETDYVKRSVLAAGKLIREAVRIADQEAIYQCRRCGVAVSADEFARSQKAFQRVFCDKCFDEVYLDRRIAYRYDERSRILEGYAIRPDFYLPEFDVYIEYWGMNTADYKIGMLKKQQLYQQEGKRLISLHFREKDRLQELLEGKLSQYVRLPDAGSAR